MFPRAPEADHHVDRIEPIARQRLLHGLGHFLGGLCPNLDELLTALVVSDHTFLILLLDLLGAGLKRSQDGWLVVRCHYVVQPDRQTGTGRIGESEFLDSIQRPLDGRSCRSVR